MNASDGPGMAAREDIGGMSLIWAECFGDSPALAASLLELLWSKTVVFRSGGHVRSFMCAFDFSLPDGLRCSYLYALATQPGARGRGLGSRTLLAAIRESFSRGCAAACLRPASPSLAGWYENSFGMRPVSYYSQVPITPAPGSAPAALRELSWQEYLLRRTDSFSPPPEMLRAQDLLFREYGGGFYELVFPGRSFTLCCGVSDSKALIIETDCPQELLPSVLPLLGCRNACIQRPASRGVPLLAAENKSIMFQNVFVPFSLD